MPCTYDSAKLYLSTYWDTGVQYNFKEENVRRTLKIVAATLANSTNKGIPIQSINTHLLHSGGANALTEWDILVGGMGPPSRKKFRRNWRVMPWEC